MKKIGILTLYDNNNYGNRLQNYAVQKVWEKLGNETETIINKTYDSENRNLKYYLEILSVKKIKEKIKSIYNNKIVYRKNKELLNNRTKNFLEFNKNIKFSNQDIINGMDFSLIEKGYDLFSIGSDQVWNPYSTYIKDINFAMFSPKQKNIAFSASFGVSEIPERLHEKYKEGLNNFNYISVREDKGKEIVEDLSDNTAEVLLDPTMMLTKDEWLSISKKANGLPDKYITTLFLGNISKSRKKVIDEISKENNWNVVGLNSLKYKEYFDYGPSEFINVINNSKLVLTDSFHVAVFSILFNKPFYVFERQSATKSMNSRINTLLKKFNFEDRIFKDEKQSIKLDCDFTHVEDILKAEREKTMKFLKKAQEMKEN